MSGRAGGEPVRIGDDRDETDDLGMAGLRFSPNRVIVRADRTEVVSNTGDIVGHFVTHAPSFRYGDDIGLHLGQVDQLTFVSVERREITGIFIDCRAGSETLGRRVVLRFATSLSRKLAIPAGVAHTFEDIGGVVTRNDLRLFCSPSNPQWRFEDDLVSMPLDTPPERIVPVEVNAWPLPQAAALLFYRMQRELMRGGRSRTERRVRASLAGEAIEVAASMDFSFRPLAMPAAAAGVRFEPNSMFPVADDSWGLVPSTPSCAMDLWVLRGGGPDAEYAVHRQHDVLHTFLDRAGDEVWLDVVDLRDGSGRTASIPIRCDERFHVRIPAGIAHRYRGDGAFVVRAETEPPGGGDGARVVPTQAGAPS